jgi:hypothetical protein
MKTKINTEKLRSALNEGNGSISAFEKHIIQEGVKQLVFGNGNYQIELPGSPGITIKTITPEMHGLLKEYQIIEETNELIENSAEVEETLKKLQIEVIKGYTLKDVIDKSVKSEVWNYNGQINNAMFFGTRRDWIKTLTTLINSLSGDIHRNNDDPANVIFCSPEMGVIIDDLEYFHISKSFKLKNKLTYSGSIGGKYSVIINPNLPVHVMIVACIEELVDTGEAYCINTQLKDFDFTSVFKKSKYGIIQIENFKK